jgi:hypothetical protein
VRPRLCTVALAYPRGELPFIAEWLEYHLALGVDHIFLGLHVNEDLVDPSHYLTRTRPFPNMYDLRGTEAEVVNSFFAAVRPFLPHVTTYLLHRFASEPAEHREDQQRRLYNSVLGMQRETYDWICPHDIDEYIVPQPPFETISDALAECPERYAAIVMEQVVVRARWDAARRPRRPPLLVADLPRCSEIVSMNQQYHGVKTFVRCRAASSLDIHLPALADGSCTLADRRLLHYHFRGFPAETEAPPAREISIEDQVLDTADDRPWRLRRQALRSAGGPSGDGC